MFYREVRFISKGHVGVLLYYNFLSRHDIAEILLKLALNTNQSIIKPCSTEQFESVSEDQSLIQHQNDCGISPSPLVATYCLRKSVQDADVDVKDFVCHNFYVDDGLIFSWCLIWIRPASNSSFLHKISACCSTYFALVFVASSCAFLFQIVECVELPIVLDL